MRVLVTGNAGYVGPVVVEHLAARHPDWALVGFDAGYFLACLSDPTATPEQPLETQVIGDLRDVDSIPFNGVDAVVHLAGLSNDPMGNRFVELTEDINIRAAEELILRARAVGVRRFVFASSCSMYGATSGEARRESDELNPLTPYARSKVAIERFLETHAATDFTVTCLRFATACGASPRLRLDLVLNDFVATALATGRITILSDGTPWRPLIDVADMARAVEWSLTGRDDVPDPFLAVNTGSEGWNHQVRDLARAVADRIPGAVVELAAEAPADARSYRVDFGLFRRVAPDHQPQVRLEESIDRLIQHIRAGGPTFDGTRHGRFSRLHELGRLQEQGRLDAELRWVRSAGPSSPS